MATGMREDAATLARSSADREEVLAGLPRRADRDPDQQVRVGRAFADCHAAQHTFLQRHVDTVYDVLTENRSVRLRLTDLIWAAAERFPGLVPSRERLKTELACRQADRDGYEIDQSIFCAAVLRSPQAGRHLIDAMLMPTSHSSALLEKFRITGRIELDSVLIERRENAAHVTFRNTHSLNAEDDRLIADLETAVDLALLDDGVQVGVLRGGEVDHPRYAGRRVFSAGINLKDLRDGAISFADFLMGRELGYVNKIFRGLRIADNATMQKPWIGAVDSFAIGGGMQLLLVLDRVIAEEGAYFSLPAAEEGIVPGLANLRLPRLVGARLARQVILGGRRIATTDPDAWRLCDDIVPAHEIPSAIERAVSELRAPAVAANRRMLNLAAEPVDLFREYLAEFALIQAERAYSADVLAKVERRWQTSRSRRGD